MGGATSRVPTDSDEGERTRTDVDRLLRDLAAEHPEHEWIAVGPARPVPVHAGVDRCALSRAVAFAHGGELRVETVSESGQRVELLLPRSTR